MNTKSSLILIVGAIAVALGAYLFLGQSPEAPAPAPDQATEAPAPSAGQTASDGSGTAATGTAGVVELTPADQAPACVQYSWDGAKWTCTSGSAATGPTGSN